MLVCSRLNLTYTRSHTRERTRVCRRRGFVCALAVARKTAFFHSIGVHSVARARLPRALHGSCADSTFDGGRMWVLFVSTATQPPPTSMVSTMFMQYPHHAQWCAHNTQLINESARRHGNGVQSVRASVCAPKIYFAHERTDGWFVWVVRAMSNYKTSWSGCVVWALDPVYIHILYLHTHSRKSYPLYDFLGNVIIIFVVRCQLGTSAQPLSTVKAFFCIIELVVASWSFYWPNAIQSMLSPQFAFSISTLAAMYVHCKFTTPNLPRRVHGEIDRNRCTFNQFNINSS